MLALSYIQPKSQKLRKGGNGLPTTLEKITGILAEGLGVNESEIKPESKLVDDLGADSLDLVQIVMSIEDEFPGLEIPDEDVKKIKTVNDIVAYLQGKGLQ